MNPERTAQLRGKITELVQNGTDRAVILEFGRRFKDKFSIESDKVKPLQYSGKMPTQEKLTQTSMPTLEEEMSNVSSPDALLKRDVQGMNTRLAALTGVDTPQKYNATEGQQYVKEDAKAAGLEGLDSGLAASLLGVREGALDMAYGARDIVGEGRPQASIDRNRAIARDAKGFESAKLIPQIALGSLAAGPAGAIGSIGLRGAAMAGIAAAEMGTSALGEGATAGEAWTQAGIGAALGVGSEVLAPIAKGMIKAVNKASKAKIAKNALKANGGITKAAEDSARKAGLTGEEFLEEMVTSVPVEEVKDIYQPLVKATKNIKGKNFDASAEQIAKQSDPNLDVVRASVDLGIPIDEIPLSVVSQNPSVRNVSASLEAKTSTKSAALMDKFKKSIDEATEDFRAADSAAISEENKSKLQKVINNIRSEESAAYKKLDDAIPGETKVEIPEIKKYYDEQALKYEGSKLPQHLSKLKNYFKGIDKGSVTPTYESIKAFKNEVGASLNYGSDLFRNLNDANKNQLYGVLRDAQGRAASAKGLGDVFEEASSLTVAKKAAADRLKKAFGKDLDINSVQKLTSGINGLADNKEALFKKAFKSLEGLKRADKVESIAASLGEIFTKTEQSRKFHKAWKENKRSMQILKRLLPAGMKRRVNAVGELMNAMSGAQGSRTGIHTAVDQGVEQASPRLERMLTKLANSAEVTGAVAGGAGGGLLGAGVGAAVGTMAKAGINAVFRTPNALAVDKMLTNPRFQTVMKRLYTGDIKAAKKASDALEKSSVFKKWLMLQKPSTTRAISTLGFANWINSGDNNER